MYKLNLCLKNKWIGSKICKFKNLKSLQWLRSLRTKKYSLLRIDKLFSPRYSRNIKIIEKWWLAFWLVKKSSSIINKYRVLCSSEHNTDYLKIRIYFKCIKEKKNFFNLLKMKL